MTTPSPRSFTAFQGMLLLNTGPIVQVALAVKSALENDSPEQILTFDDTTGRVVDLYLRGTDTEVLARLAKSDLATSNAQIAAADPTPDPSPDSATDPRGRGRPKLGVVAREVTLLPRHWEFLSAQPGGASVVLRRLVEEARRTGVAERTARAAQEIAYRFMSALAGDLPGYEEALRALFANDPARFEQHVREWPNDVRAYATKLAFGDRTPDTLA